MADRPVQSDAAPFRPISTVFDTSVRDIWYFNGDELEKLHEVA